MNMVFFQAFGKTNPTLPLNDAGQIIRGNACRLDWEKVCSKTEGDEVYIMGNPPYLGFNVQSDAQKQDILINYPNKDNLKFLDYIVTWFIKGSYFIDDNSSFAFVSTNSICQGAQVSMIWPYVLNNENEIFFAYPDFVWTNNAKNNAGVICSIIGVRKKSVKPKFIYKDSVKLEVKNINAYLTSGSNVIITKRQKPLSFKNEMSTGNIPYDGGNLIISDIERSELINSYPESEKFILKLSGSKEYINNLNRYCIWIEDKYLNDAIKIKPLNDRLEAVRESRLKGGKIARNYAHIPHRFYMTNRSKQSQLLIPRVSSIRRKFIPLGFLDSNVIISDSAQAIYDPESYLFSVLNSSMHMIWVNLTAGKLKNDYRYSAVLCYNTFPFPAISIHRKEELNQCTFRILEEREKHPEKTLAELYDPDKMPVGLKEAHRLNDEAVERCYRSTPFTSDEERLEYLFKLYEKMIQEEKEKDTLFAKQKKTTKKK